MLEVPQDAEQAVQAEQQPPVRPIVSRFLFQAGMRGVSEVYQANIGQRGRGRGWPAISPPRPFVDNEEGGGIEAVGVQGGDEGSQFCKFLQHRRHHLQNGITFK